jgi:hypothetical protein
MLPDINNLDDLYISEDVDAYEDHADGLMDALFGEVEHILSVESTESRTLVPVKSRKHSATSNRRNSPRLLPSDTVSITKLDLPELAIPPISEQDMIWVQPHVASGSEIVLADPKFLESQLQAAPEKTPSRLLDRVVAIAACTSVIFAASIWIARYGLADIIQQRTAVLPPSTSQPDPESAQFAEEVKQSFIAISNKEKEKTVAASNATQSTNLSTLPLANNPQLATSFQPIYVPVYQPPTPASPVGLMPANAANPTNPAPLAPVTTAPVPNNAPASQPAPTAVASVPSTTLVGILDIGDRSSAMFEMNGSVQSVLVGDRVAGNGWVLNRITQQEAILKRGNETKTLYVGQKF